MTSQISIRNLMKLEIKQHSWMFALSALVQFLSGPVYYLLTVDTSLAGHTDRIYILNQLCGFFDAYYFLLQLIAMMITISFCIFSYRYLFSKRMVDLYHGVPITRTRLFWVKYLHGFLVWLLPFVISTLTVLVISILRLSYYFGFTYMGQLLFSWASSVLLLLFCFFIFYHLFLVAAYLSGNILNLLTNIVIMGISVASIYALLLSFAECFFKTFCQTPSTRMLDMVLGLSPLLSPFYMYYYLRGKGFTALMTQHPLLWVISILVCLLLLGCVILLCTKRPSELAERGTINRLYKIPARIIATLMASLAASLFFSELVSDSSGFFWGIFGAALGGVLCFGAIDSIYHTTIRSFFKNLRQMAGITITCVLVVIIFHLDVFGYDTYLPDKEDIAGMAIYMYTFGDDTSGIYLNENSAWSYSDANTVVYQENLLMDPDVCYDLLDNVIHGRVDAERRYFYAKIQLENGRTYYRQYSINSRDYKALVPFIETDDYKYTNYKISTGLMGYPSTITVQLRDSNLSLQLTGDDIVTFMDAYTADFEEHYSVEELSSYFYCIGLDLEYFNEAGSHFYSYLVVPDNYERTLSYLHDLYPDYIPYITSPERIAGITPGISAGSIAEYGSVYNYFAEIGEVEFVGITESTETEYNGAVFVESADVYSSPIPNAKLTITDPALIEELYPLLYFGQYVSSFEQRDYIYFGEVQTTGGRYVDCWVKPNTLPEKYIEMIEEALESSAQ